MNNDEALELVKECEYRAVESNRLRVGKFGGMALLLILRMLLEIMNRLSDFETEEGNQATDCPDSSPRELISAHGVEIHFARIVKSMRLPHENDLPPQPREISGMKDLWFHLICEQPMAEMAEFLGTSPEMVRLALDIGIRSGDERNVGIRRHL